MNFRKAQATLLPSEQLKALGWMPFEISVRAGKIDPGHRVSAATVDSLIDGGYAQLDPQGPLFVRGPSDIAPFDELHRLVITPAGAKGLAAFDLVFDREAAVLDHGTALKIGACMPSNSPYAPAPSQPTAGEFLLPPNCVPGRRPLSQ